MDKSSQHSFTKDLAVNQYFPLVTVSVQLLSGCSYPFSEAYWNLIFSHINLHTWESTVTHWESTVLAETVLYSLRKYCTRWESTLLTEKVLYSLRKSCAHWESPLLTEKALYSLRKSCTHWESPVLIDKVLYSLRKYCTHWESPVLTEKVLHSLRKSCTPCVISYVKFVYCHQSSRDHFSIFPFHQAISSTHFSGPKCWFSVCVGGWARRFIYGHFLDLLLI